MVTRFILFIFFFTQIAIDGFPLRKKYTFPSVIATTTTTTTHDVVCDFIFYYCYYFRSCTGDDVVFVIVCSARVISDIFS